MAKYRKSRMFAPAGFFECEGRGLQWLGQAQAQGGPRVVDVYGWGDNWLDIERVEGCSPTPKAAYDFGAALAHMHDAGDWDDPVSYLADGRLRPMVQLGIQRGELTDDDLALTNEVIDRLPDLLGRAADDAPARVHGDLWSGNVMWTRDSGDVQAVLIDPAAHGGHREEDLAMLNLFGMSYLHEILDGYQRVHPLKAGWQDRITIWQLYPIAGHCVFFGGGYVSEYRSMCHSLLK